MNTNNNSTSNSLPAELGEDEPGALVALELQSKVGVLLDELPDTLRSKAEKQLVAKPEDFWVDRAKDQIRLMSYRLVFRDSFYDESEAKGALPLPPEQIWHVKTIGTPYRTYSNGHDLVVVDYVFNSTLLSPRMSPAASEVALGVIGGSWSEPFILPLDPTLIFQRTGFACIDENQFPPRSVDPEEVDTFYDHESDIEDELSIEGTHQTVMPERSCIEALDAEIGKVETNLVFERLKWDSNLADQVRIGEITNPSGPDLVVEESDFRVHRVSYRYVAADSCAVADESVQGTGWRKLLQFGAADRNRGATTLEIGDIDYFVYGNETDLTKRGIYEYSSCHNHYHFKHYGSFTFGEVVNHKMGFCLQSTNRYSNHELSPLLNIYAGCSFQGIEVGWVDQYKAGLEGQWVDVTDIDTSAGPVTRQLTFHSNPDGFLCEGTPIVDGDGNPVFEATQFVTDEGDKVYRQKCDYANGALENNIHSYSVTIPTNGNGYVTEHCTRGEIGPLRNCDFELVKGAQAINCTPGQDVKLRVSIPEAAAQAIRVCEYSFALASAIPCTYNGPHNAKSLANVIIETVSSELTFACPTPLDYYENGGKFSLYVAPLVPEDLVAPVSYIVI